MKNPRVDYNKTAQTRRRKINFQLRHSEFEFQQQTLTTNGQNNFAQASRNRSRR